MTDEAIRDLVIEHDKNIGLMAQSIENLAQVVTVTVISLK